MARSRTRTPANVTSEVVQVTPDLANQWLEQNVHNRSIRPAHLASLVRDMQNGRWRLNGDAIEFNSQGQLINGQHRLYAVVKARKTMPMLVVRGVSRSAQETRDTGAKRTFKDMLALRGEENTSDIAAATRLHWRLVHDDITSRMYVPSVGELFEHLDENPGLRTATTVGHSIAGAIKGPRSVYSTFAYETFRIDPTDAEAFIESLRSGADLSETSPIYHLRKYLTRIETAVHRPRVEFTLAMMFKAWNLYREGVPVRQLSFKAGGANPEEFPLPK